jgi:hypothetical protein
MKKYKVTFSVFNLFNGTQPEVVKLQTYVKTLTGTIAGTTWFTTKMEYGVYVAVIGFVLDAVLACIYLEEKNERHLKK